MADSGWTTTVNYPDASPAKERGWGTIGGVFNNAGGAVADLFASQGSELRAQGLGIEAGNLDAAAAFAGQNIGFTQQSTAIKEMAAERNIFQTMGAQEAGTAGAGFSASGSALDLLRSSAQQGALTKAVLGQQGLITEAGFAEQQRAYQAQANAARLAQQSAENDSDAQEIGGFIKGGLSIANLLSL